MQPATRLNVFRKRSWGFDVFAYKNVLVVKFEPPAYVNALELIGRCITWNTQPEGRMKGRPFGYEYSSASRGPASARHCPI